MENNQDKKKLCEICDSNATNICLKCFAYFCESCYKTIHTKRRNNEHRKDKIDYLVPIETKCLEHPKYPKEIFCKDEKSNYIDFNFIFFNYITLLCFMLFSKSSQKS